MPELTPKASTRVALNSGLLALVMGIFFLTINLKSELLSQEIVVIQLVLSIPLFLTSTLAYSKVSYKKHPEKWDKLGWITFTLGYAFILNVVGILIGRMISILISMIFFASSWILALVYSFVHISYDRSKIKERIVKNTFFISVQLFFGLLVVLGVV